VRWGGIVRRRRAMRRRAIRRRAIRRRAMRRRAMRRRAMRRRYKVGGRGRLKDEGEEGHDCQRREQMGWGGARRCLPTD